MRDQAVARATQYARPVVTVRRELQSEISSCARARRTQLHWFPFGNSGGTAATVVKQ